jgi:hypothetical protein
MRTTFWGLVVIEIGEPRWEFIGGWTVLGAGFRFEGQGEVEVNYLRDQLQTAIIVHDHVQEFQIWHCGGNLFSYLSFAN